MLYIIGLGFLVYRVSPHYVRLSAPRLLSCCALERCLTLEVIHVSTPAWNMTGRRHRQTGRYVVLREICALATPIVNLGLRELRWPAFTVGCWSFHEELRKSGGGDCIVHKPISLGRGCGTIGMGNPSPEGRPPELQREPRSLRPGLLCPHQRRTAMKVQNRFDQPEGPLPADTRRQSFERCRSRKLCAGLPISATVTIRMRDGQLYFD
jgi:hypothetical protein